MIWKQNEIEYLNNNFSTKPNSLLSNVLKKSQNALRVKASRGTSSQSQQSYGASYWSPVYRHCRTSVFVGSLWLLSLRGIMSCPFISKGSFLRLLDKTFMRELPNALTLSRNDWPITIRYTTSQSGIAGFNAKQNTVYNRQIMNVSKKKRSIHPIHNKLWGILDTLLNQFESYSAILNETNKG